MMALDLIARVALLLNWSRFLRRCEKIFIGENMEIASIAVDIPRGLCAGLVYFVSTWGKCAALMSILGGR